MLRAAIARLFRHSLIYALAEQLGRLAGFLLLPLTTGYLSEAEFGVREILATTLALLAQISGLNITAAMSRFYFEERDEREKLAVFSTAWLTVGATAAVLAGVLATMSGTLASWFPVDAPGLDHYLRLSLAIFVFQILREVQNKILQTLERSATFATLSVSKLVVEIGLQIYFLAGLKLGLEGLLFAVLLAEAGFAVITALILLPSIGLRFRPGLFRAMFAFSLPLVPNGVLQFGLHSADRYVVGGVGGDTALGLYALSYKLGYIPNYLVLGPFLLIWYPFVFSLGAQERQREMVGRLAPYFLFLMSAAVVGVGVFAHELVDLAGSRPGFHRAWVAIPFVALGYWLWGLFQVLQTGLYAAKKTRPLPLLTLAALLVNLYLNFVLVPTLGFVGAAIATVLTFATLCIATEPVVREVFPVAYPWRKILAPITVGALVILIASLLPDRWSPAALVGTRVALFGAWLLAAWFGLAFDASERAAALKELAIRLRSLRARGTTSG